MDLEMVLASHYGDHIPGAANVLTALTHACIIAYLVVSPEEISRTESTQRGAMEGDVDLFLHANDEDSEHRKAAIVYRAIPVIPSQEICLRARNRTSHMVKNVNLEPLAPGTT
jgi:hypothetical protein